MGRGLWIALLLALAGCTNVNRPLNADNVPLEKRDKNYTHASLRPAGSEDGIFVGLAISGGGSRASVFGAACMLELQRAGLLQRVDYISAVSGGTLPAAYYCVRGDEWNPGEVQRRLTHSFAGDVIFQIIQPWVFIALTFSHADRSDLLAGSFNSHLFRRDGKSLTFGDLRPDRPRLLINATDLQSGRAFVFTDEQFDEINSDLSRYPLAYACAASSAVPVVMHHVTLRDYSTAFKQYRHLIDGGVSDNLGIVSLLDTFEKHRKTARQANQPDPYPKGAIFMIIDARTQFDAQLSDHGDIGFVRTLATGAGLTSTALLNRASTATLSEVIVRYTPDDVSARVMREQVLQLKNEGYLKMSDGQQGSLRVVHLALSHLAGIEDLPFTSFSEKVNNVATYFDISSAEAYNLTKAAELIVRRRFEAELAEIGEELGIGGQVTGPSTAPLR